MQSEPQSEAETAAPSNGLCSNRMTWRCRETSRMGITPPGATSSKSRTDRPLTCCEYLQELKVRITKNNVTLFFKISYNFMMFYDRFFYFRIWWVRVSFGNCTRHLLNVNQRLLLSSQCRQILHGGDNTNSRRRLPR